MDPKSFVFHWGIKCFSLPASNVSSITMPLTWPSVSSWLFTAVVEQSAFVAIHLWLWGSLDPSPCLCVSLWSSSDLFHDPFLSKIPRFWNGSLGKTFCQLLTVNSWPSYEAASIAAREVFGHFQKGILWLVPHCKPILCTFCLQWGHWVFWLFCLRRDLGLFVILTPLHQPEVREDQRCPLCPSPCQTKWTKFYLTAFALFVCANLMLLCHDPKCSKFQDSTSAYELNWNFLMSFISQVFAWFCHRLVWIQNFIHNYSDIFDLWVPFHHRTRIPVLVLSEFDLNHD